MSSLAVSSILQGPDVTMSKSEDIVPCGATKLGCF